MTKIKINKGWRPYFLFALIIIVLTVFILLKNKYYPWS